PWNNPDEPAHFNYIAHIVEHREFPELTTGDWDAALLDQAIPERFHPRFEVSSIRYEAHQPPLYYLLGAPVYAATAQVSLRARVFAVRGISIALGLLLGCAVFALAREVLPDRPFSAPLAAGIALLIPMSTAMAASINNDMLAMALSTLALLMTLRFLRWWSKDRLMKHDGPSGSMLFQARGAPANLMALSLGVMIGLLLLTKLTVYVIVLLMLGSLVAIARQALALGTFDKYGRFVLLVGLSAMIVSGWWFIRSGVVYGWGDLLAQRRHEVVVIGQAQYEHFGVENWRYLVTTVFHSLFAQFGWMTIVVDDLTYALYGVFVLLGVCGLVMAGSAALTPPMRVLSVAMLLVAGQLLYYNASFIQAQGRYLFPAIGPLAVMLALGWSRLGESRVGCRDVPLILWSSLALTTGIAGIADWEVGIGSATLFALCLVFLGAGYHWARRPASGHAQTGAGHTVLILSSFGLLNLMCLLRYVIPYYRG
ncbi:MAG: hypothetical protein ACKVVP_03355, partial [Chloroflexota bacterium]